MTTRFSELFQNGETQSEERVFHAPEDWLQGRSVYGGLQAAFAVDTIRSLVPSAPLRSLQTNFIAPLSGMPKVEAKILRAGKNSTQVEARIYGGNGLATLVIAVLGKPISSKIEVTMAPPPPVPSQHTAPLQFPLLPGVTPNFLQHFKLLLMAGNPPFSGKETREAVFQFDLLDTGFATENHIVAMADVVPPLGLSFLSTPSFGSTMSWMLELLVEPASDLPLQNWRMDTKLRSAKDGYTSQSSILWSPGGEAIALSHQCMAVY